MITQYLDTRDMFSQFEKEIEIAWETREKAKQAIALIQKQSKESGKPVIFSTQKRKKK